MLSQQNRSPSTSSQEQQAPLDLGQTYRLVRGNFGGYNHAPMYDEGLHIHVKILSGPNEFGIYQGTTRDDQGQHLGPGGGWSPQYEEQICRFRRSELETIPARHEK